MLLHSQITSIFKASPFPSLVLYPDSHFTIAEANQAYLKAAGTIEKEIAGKELFEVFNPKAAGETDIADLKYSLEQVLITKIPHKMNTQKFEIPIEGTDEINTRYCIPINTPVLNEDREIEFILFSAIDITVKDLPVEKEKMQTDPDSSVVQDAREAKPAKEQENKVLHMLQERIKEQSCLYRISNLNEQELSIEELLAEAVAILPEGWQYAGVAAAAIEYGGKTYQTHDYKETEWVMSAKTEKPKDNFLAAKVVYLKERPDHDEGPFLKEERNLIDSVANHLSLKIDRIRSHQELEKKQRLLDKAYQLAHIGTWEFDMATHNLEWSPVTKEVHGFDQDYEPDLESTINLFKEGINRETFAKVARDAVEHEMPFDVELKIISGEGDERWIRATGEPEYEDGVCKRFYGISQNVSDRRQAQEELQLREQRFKSLVQDGSDLVAILDSQANYKYVSPTSGSILGIPAEDFIGTNALDYIHEDDKSRIIDLLSVLSSNQRINIPPYRFIDSKGNWRWIETTLTNMMEDPAVGGLVANSRDVTEQKHQQQQNLESLKEKETLLAEIHHRVKNNLAVVSGMMQLQASEEDNREITDRLFDSIIRIKTMANIHEQLYQSNSFSRLEFANNIRSLVLNILKTFQSGTEVNIDFSCDPVQLNINQAIPCSLIVNEVITNIFKHAFPQRKKGNIMINLSEVEKNDCICLSIGDDGIGLPENFDEAGNSSLGLNLIDVLSQQLSADYKYESYKEGTLFTIRFEKDELKGIGNNFLK